MKEMKEIRDQFVSVRLTKTQHEQLKKLADDNLTNPSTIVYQLIIQKLRNDLYLDNLDKKKEE